MNEMDLKKMKQEFDAIPLPEGLEAGVKTSMERAKCAQAKQKGVINMKQIWKRAGTTVAAATAAMAILVNVSPNAAYAMEQVPVLGAITRVITLRTYQDQQGNASAHVEVPTVEGGSGELNDAIQQYTDAIIAEYEKDAAAVMEYDQDPNAPEAQTNHYSLDLSYTVVTDNSALFALRFDKALVMASGVESVKIYNMDKATGKLLTLSDLFQADSDYISVLTQSIQRQMKERMEADESLTYWVDSDIPAMDFTQLDPNATFYINEDGQLVIVFDEGDVAPMYMGVVEFSIDKQDIADIIQPVYFQ